jgi:hypothetical protein
MLDREFIHGKRLYRIFLRLQVAVETGKIVYSQIGEQHRRKTNNGHESHSCSPPASHKA